MLLAGIVGHEEKTKTASLINSLLALTGKRVSVADSAVLAGRDAAMLKNYIRELEKNKTSILLLKLNEPDIKKLIQNGISFDIVIYTGMELEDRLYDLLNEQGISIVNVDDEALLSRFNGKGGNVVTYGFNSKACVTTSSIGDPLCEGSFICCLQEAISDHNGEWIEPQEYKLKLEPGQFDTHNILAAASFAIVNGIDLNHLNCI